MRRTCHQHSSQGYARNKQTKRTKHASDIDTSGLGATTGKGKWRVDVHHPSCSRSNSVDGDQAANDQTSPAVESEGQGPQGSRRVWGACKVTRRPLRTWTSRQSRRCAVGRMRNTQGSPSSTASPSSPATDQCKHAQTTTVQLHGEAWDNVNGPRTKLDSEAKPKRSYNYFLGW